MRFTVEGGRLAANDERNCKRKTSMSERQTTHDKRQTNNHELQITNAEYADDDAAALYDLQYDGYDDDLALYEGFARRGDTPSLELCVGSGRVALHLAQSGLDVAGVDASAAMLARLRAKLDSASSPRVRAIEADIRDFDLGERFDLVYCALSSFELLLTAEDQRAALRCVARHLAPGGTYVMQLRSPVHVDWTADDSPLQFEWTRHDPATGDSVQKMSSQRVSRERQCVLHTIIFDRVAPDGGVRRRTLEVTLRVTARSELEMLLREAGLRLTRIYGDADLSPYTDDSDTMIIVAEHAG